MTAQSPIVPTEAAIVAKFAEARVSAGMSYRQLASVLTDAGAPIAVSSLQKMLSLTEPRRPLSITEFIAFTRVFNMNPAALLHLTDAQEAPQAIRAQEFLASSARELRDSLPALRSALAQIEQVEESIEARLRSLGTTK